MKKKTNYIVHILSYYAYNTRWQQQYVNANNNNRISAYWMHWLVFYSFESNGAFKKYIWKNTTTHSSNEQKKYVFNWFSFSGFFFKENVWYLEKSLKMNYIILRYIFSRMLLLSFFFQPWKKHIFLLFSLNIQCLYEEATKKNWHKKKVKLKICIRYFYITWILHLWERTTYYKTKMIPYR